jgi:hypothetical protein
MGLASKRLAAAAGLAAVRDVKRELPVIAVRLRVRKFGVMPKKLTGRRVGVRGSKVGVKKE